MAHSNGKPQAKRAPTNFLEALRDLGSDFKSEAKIQVSKIVTDDIPQSLGLSGTLAPNESVSVSQMANKPEQQDSKAESQFSARLHQVREEERAFYSQREAATKQQIQAILTEIKSLAKSAGGLAREVEIAAFQAPANPGVYHRSFFSQLKSLIMALRQQVQDSSHWLHTTNSRVAKKGYWGQVASSGTKFMLSSERYMVTSTG